MLNWSSEAHYHETVKKEEAIYNKVFEQFKDISIAELSKNHEALKIGRSLFSNHCATCHGTDAKGSKGFPNLTDNDWLYGQEPEQIKTSIANGRNGIMTPFSMILGDDGVKEVAKYVKSLSDEKTDADNVKIGHDKFQTFCTACHGADAKGNQIIGAPNLTDSIWLYGSTEKDIIETISLGRSGKMPAHNQLLTEDKINLITAYVYQLSKE